jgi:hypothetical protein
MKFGIIGLNYCAASIHGRSIQLSILHAIKYYVICDYYLLSLLHCLLMVNDIYILKRISSNFWKSISLFINFSMAQRIRRSPLVFAGQTNLCPEKFKIIPILKWIRREQISTSSSSRILWMRSLFDYWLNFLWTFWFLI